MPEDSGFDPADIQPRIGKRFVTGSGSRYGINNGLKFEGTASTQEINGAEVAMMAGVANENYRSMRIALDPSISSRDEAIDAMGDYGLKPPGPGLHLAVILTEPECVARMKYGMISSRIDHIE